MDPSSRYSTSSEATISYACKCTASPSASLPRLLLRPPIRTTLKARPGGAATRLRLLLMPLTSYRRVRHRSAPKSILGWEKPLLCRHPLLLLLHGIMKSLPHLTQVLVTPPALHFLHTARSNLITMGLLPDTIVITSAAAFSSSMRSITIASINRSIIADGKKTSQTMRQVAIVSSKCSRRFSAKAKGMCVTGKGMVFYSSSRMDRGFGWCRVPAGRTSFGEEVRRSICLWFNPCRSNRPRFDRA